MNLLAGVFFAISLPIFVLGLLRITYLPLAVRFELKRRRKPVFNGPRPLVTVVVPAYNEERVLANCVNSILADRYPYKEIILVDDGSTDGTLAVMLRYTHLPDVTVVSVANGGKGAALNAGIARAKGEIVLLVDADGIFTSTTVARILTGFNHVDVGAVCGNDEPVNLDRTQTRLLALLTHVGTGFARRALAQIDCLPIVSGNLGAFRRSVLEEIGGLREGFIGEDLELTWRVHRAGYRVNFHPRAKVYAESPSTLRGLWRQRVRWTRGLIQTTRLHRDMMFRARYGAFGWFLPINAISMLVLPVLQLTALVLIPILVQAGASPVSGTVLGILAWLGILVGVAAALFAMMLDRARHDLRYLYVLPMWVPYSFFMSAVTVWSLILELRGREARWNKLERTGTVTRSLVGSR